MLRLNESTISAGVTIQQLKPKIFGGDSRISKTQKRSNRQSSISMSQVGIETQVKVVQRNKKEEDPKTNHKELASKDLQDVISNVKSSVVAPPMEKLVIKLMDTILIDKDSNFQPQKWIYTDLLGRIQFKDISSVEIDEVVKAFLLNVRKETQLVNGQISNEDLLDFFGQRVS